MRRAKRQFGERRRQCQIRRIVARILRQIRPQTIIPRRPFLRKQESHSVVPILTADSHTIVRLPPPLLNEIPAFAGMVPGRTGVCVNFGVICIYDTVRFLPTQEWSTCVQGIVGGFICGIGNYLAIVAAHG